LSGQTDWPATAIHHSFLGVILVYRIEFCQLLSVTGVVKQCWLVTRNNDSLLRDSGANLAANRW